MNKSTLINRIAIVSVLLGTPGIVMAEMSREAVQPPQPTSQFQRIEQPLWAKGAVTVGGLGFIGLELWWFLFSKPKPRKAITSNHSSD